MKLQVAAGVLFDEVEHFCTDAFVAVVSGDDDADLCFMVVWLEVYEVYDAMSWVPLAINCFKV